MRRLVLILALLTACGPEPEPELPPKVLVIGLDGLRGDGIGASETPTLDALIDAGAWTMVARTQLEAPTFSGPGWTSILTGVDADKHLVYANGGYDDLDRSYPSFLQRARDLGFSTAASIHWLPIQTDILEDDVLDESTPATDDLLVAEGMADLLTDFDLDVNFVHLDDIDHQGHVGGFSIENPDYIAEIEEIDSEVGLIIDALEARPTRDEERWLVVVTSDHGGAGNAHGGQTDDSQRIPLIVAGDGVVAGELVEGTESHLDVHPTVMKYLGCPDEPDWRLDGEARALVDASL